MVDSSPTSLTTRIVGTIAEITEMDPSSIGPLNEVIDLEALERLYTRSSGKWKVQFNIEGNEVVVRNDGMIQVNGQTYEQRNPLSQ